MKYSVRLLLQYTVDGGDTFFEDSVVMFEAASFEGAYDKADRYVKDNGLTEPYRNAEGFTVTCKARVVDCFSVIEEDDGTEVYSIFRKNRTPLPDTDFSAILTDGCSAEERKSLRRW